MVYGHGEGIGALRRRAGRAAPGPVYAAIDLGTNNCRLLVARATDGGFRVVDSFSRIVRLGEGLAMTGTLSEAAIERTIAALGVCATKLRRNRVAHVRSVATEACRRARNCEDFLARVRRETGLGLEIISTREEADLAVAGCVPLLDGDAPFAIMFDIGGGSTEVSWLRQRAGVEPEMLDWLSIPCGVVNFAERFGGDRVSARVYSAMVAEVDRLLRPFEERHGIREKVASGAVCMLGTSGTVTTLAGVHLDLPRYNRAAVDGQYLTFAAMESVIRRLAAMNYDQRAAHPCVGPERADLVVAGLAILDAICRAWPVGGLRVADRGLREGILLGLMARFPPDAVAPSGVASPCRAGEA